MGYNGEIFRRFCPFNTTPHTTFLFTTTIGYNKLRLWNIQKQSSRAGSVL